MSDTADDQGAFDYLDTRFALKQALSGESEQPVREAAAAWIDAIRARVEKTRAG